MTSVLEPPSGMISGSADPFRYDGVKYDPNEVSGRCCSMIRQGARILDVGCGTGSMSVILRDRLNASIVGVEPSEERAKLAASRGLDVRCCYLNNEVLDALGKFDYVIFTDVLEHLSDPPAMLEMVKRGLNENGCVIASVPNVAHWSIRWNLAVGRFDYEDCGIMDATHLRWFTKKSIIRLFTGAGFSVTDVQPTAMVGLGVYRRPNVFRLLRTRTRQKLIRFLSRRMSELFACQFVVKAQVER